MRCVEGHDVSACTWLKTGDRLRERLSAAGQRSVE
jgi:hypothetical protein